MELNDTENDVEQVNIIKILIKKTKIEITFVHNNSDSDNWSSSDVGFDAENETDTESESEENVNNTQLKHVNIINKTDAKVVKTNEKKIKITVSPTAMECRRTQADDN